MPTGDNSGKEEVPADLRDVEREKDKDRPSKSKGPAKTKDLSHVPCKFFKVGSCTAGSSCPFSHTILEPGQQKEVCTWFVKGNCKFGHKCALAHILPGQSMSMDRKNKKAAQAAASAANSNAASPREGHRGGRSQRNATQGLQGGGSNSRNTLLSGSTAPTRSLSSSRPLPLKTTLSPSTPAPPVQDTEFVSYGLPDESNKLPSAPAQGKPASSSSSDVLPASLASSPRADETTANQLEDENGHLSVNDSFSIRRNGQHDLADALDFGPVGSPTRTTQHSVRIARVNGFSPGTSPQTAGLSTSPFSAPGTQSVFMVQEHGGGDTKSRSGLSASLGALMSWGTDPRPSTVRKTSVAVYDEVVVEDGELEEFIPSSLTDLLTPEERSRRFSRTTSGRPILTSGVDEDSSGQSVAGDGHHHRYSRSVPAPSLLQDLRSIWTDGGRVAVGSPDAGNIGITGGGLGNGTPSSFQSNSGFGGRSEDMLAPSNASAAFLPGLHHYINAKSNLTAGMSSLYAHTGAMGASQQVGGGYAGLNGMALSPPRLNSFAGNSAFESPTNPLHSQTHRHTSSARPIASDGTDVYPADTDERRNAFSPSMRALQAHAPGQSLPQGLAAGYSRIHALPPPPTIPSPSTSGAFSPGRPSGFSPVAKGMIHGQNGSLDWHNSSPTSGGIPDQLGHGPQDLATTPPSNGSFGGLENMFSRLSYSAAASRSNAPAPPGIVARNASGRSWHNGQGPLSPLSGPVLTGDDDDLFSMDG